MLMMLAVRFENPRGGDADNVGFPARFLSETEWR